jgi:hypothetical protein
MDKRTQNLLVFAKILTEGGSACGMARQDYENEIIKQAERRDGESPQQAFTRYITQDETGKLLFKAAMRAPPRQAPQDLARDAESEPSTDAQRELDRLARDVARRANISLSRAKGRVLQDPQHKKLVRALMTEERRATAEVRRQRDPIWAAARALERDFS